MVGRINSQDPSIMAGVALGHMTRVLLGSSLLVGVNGSIETYVVQAAGAKEHALAGTYLNQGRVILLIVFIPVALMLMQTEYLMVTLGQDPVVAQNAQLLVYYSLPAVLISGLNDSQKKFLNCFKKNYVPMTTNIINTFLYPLWAYLFILHLHLGIVGVALTDHRSSEYRSDLQL